MDIKYLSRKFLLSVMLAVVATILIFTGTIEPYQWQWVIMATAVSYVAANALNKKTETDMRSMMPPDWKERLKSLFGREFLVCLVTIIITTVLLAMKHIGNDVWFTVCSALAVAYNIGNSVGKL